MNRLTRGAPHLTKVTGGKGRSTTEGIGPFGSGLGPGDQASQPTPSTRVCLPLLRLERGSLQVRLYDRKKKTTMTSVVPGTRRSGLDHGHRASD
jgi:hypothetical protein